ncbi:caspase-8 isoform X2 [Gadus macrocephalus]|uniref:caspase-8 isoform X2 n=1 Tax=Gadus macrocephalus TaxID=80720 RepID=UPI0028CB4BCB|nr:caspase-8 isoform X2 [Gadus macrocephalus]
MEFREKLLKVDQVLNSDDTKALAFLCKDILKCDISSVKSPIDLFKLLEEKDDLSEDQPYLLADLLRVIEHFQLLRELDLNSTMSTTVNPITPYRKLLYELSKDIGQKELKKIKFLLTKDLKRSARELNVSTLEVFLEMERMDLLSSSNLLRLEQILKDVRPVLWKQILQFKDSQGKIAQETGLVDLRPRSSSDASRRGKTDVDPPPYPMKAQQRGVCWIVNNFDFSRSSGKHKNREGTDIDEGRLSLVFSWLGFEVEEVKDATRDKMLSSMRELASRDHSGMDCVACIVLSHGLKGGVYGVDGKVVRLEELTDLLHGLRCASLRGKPKLFFIQACQGNQREQAVPVPADRPVNPKVHDQTDGPSSPGVNIQTDGPSSPGDICSDVVVASELLPSTADFLTAMATTPSHVSVRLEDKGSWFIQSLCKNLVQLVPQGQDLVSILTKVNDDVSQMFKRIGGCRQMPQHSSSLRMRVVFPVPEGRFIHKVTFDDFLGEESTV